MKKTKKKKKKKRNGENANTPKKPPASIGGWAVGRPSVVRGGRNVKKKKKAKKTAKKTPCFNGRLSSEERGTFRFETQLTHVRGEMMRSRPASHAEIDMHPSFDCTGQCDGSTATHSFFRLRLGLNSVFAFAFRVFASSSASVRIRVTSVGRSICRRESAEQRKISDQEQQNNK